MDIIKTIEIEVEPRIREKLYGPNDRNLRRLQQAFDIQVSARKNHVYLKGEATRIDQAKQVIEDLENRLGHVDYLSEADLEDIIQQALDSRFNDGQKKSRIDLTTTRVVPKTEGQQVYVEAMREHVLTVCLGPAGTGKTYLAVAMALSMLKEGAIRFVTLARPAVEAGEKLGYLPGDMQAKVNPYIRPLLDAMRDMMPVDQVQSYMENQVIEAIPLAFMRGRTFNQAAVILDEAQNTTVRQMLMFLTRLGYGSKMIVTGDDTQVDLHPDKRSGLIDAVERLSATEGVAVVRLTEKDIVRHPLVQRIVEAYGDYARRGDY